MQIHENQQNFLILIFLETRNHLFGQVKKVRRTRSSPSNFRFSVSRGIVLSQMAFFLSGGKKLSGFQPGHKIDKTRVKSARNGQKVRKKHVEMTAKRFL